MKLKVQPGDTPDIFAARYGVTVDSLKQLNDGEVAARDELNRAGGAVDPDRVIRGVAQLETGITTNILTTKIPVGGRVAAPTLDQNFEYYIVGDSRPTARMGAPTTRSYADMADEYLEANPGEALTKKSAVPRKEYTFYRTPDGSAKYWRASKPAKPNVNPLNRGNVILGGSVPGLGPDQVWHQVITNDPFANSDAKYFLQNNPAEKVVKQFVAKDHTLALVNDELYWESAPEPGQETNPEFDFLLYETRFNAPDYLKQKAALAYGLFAVPLDYRAEVVAARDLPDILANAFFPGMSVGEVQAVSAQSCRWRGVGTGAPPAYGPTSVEQQAAARTTVVIHAPRMMVMPYNFYANDTGSYALGTDLGMEVVPGPAFRLKKSWPLWESASRSSVSRLEATTVDDLKPAQRLDPQWTFRSQKQADGSEIQSAYKGKIFKLGEFTDCYSVKTGVRWLGKKAQGSSDPGGGKDVLESNALLASMRSDWVEYVEAKVGRSNFLIVLRELLTVTFFNQSKKGRDGYQIRDLRPLKSDCIYFPPLSIPFGGQSFVDAYNAKHSGATMDFETFWREYYAKPLGRAKAELLLRYGLQLTTPNPQNFLLEFKKDTLEPTGRVVIRDIGDAKIHSEVIGQIGLDQPVIQYELSNPKRPGYLPAQTNNQDRNETPDHAIAHERFDQYPLNTRTHWHQYSTFKDQYGGNQLPRKVLTTVDWGRAHYEAYLDHLATRLEHPALRIPVFGKEAYDRVMAAVEVRHKAEGDSAKQILPQALAKAGGVHNNITTDTYSDIMNDTTLAPRPSERGVLMAEWALELHTDEILHEMLAAPEALAKIKAKWV